MAKWVNRTLVQAPRNGTTTQTVNFTAATAGNFLVCITAAGVTDTLPAGWTSVISQVGTQGTYVWTKTAAAGESSLTTTNNGSNYPAPFLIYEFPAGTSVTDQSAGTVVTGAAAGNTIINTVGIAAPTTTYTFTWASPMVKDVDVTVLTDVTDGYAFSVGYVDNVTTGQATTYGTASPAKTPDSTFSIALGFGAANNPPTANAGADQTVTIGANVTVTGTDSDTDGTVTSRLWTFDSYPGATAPTLSNASTASASFTAATSGVYVLRYTVTDNGGATGSATVTITAPGTTARPTSVVGTTDWVTTGAANAAAAMADEDASTLVTSPNSPAAADTLTVDLGPLVTMTAFSMVISSWLSASGSGTATVALMEGATARKTWPLTLTTTSTDYTLTMTSAECATVTDWSALSVAITWGP